MTKPKTERLFKCTPKHRIGHGSVKYQCGEVHNFGYACTRKIGHEGNHIACGLVKHNYAVWK